MNAAWDVAVRPIAPGDVAAARALLLSNDGAASYAGGAVYHLHCAAGLEGSNTDACALVAVHGSAVVGVVVCGDVGGATGTGKLHGVAVSPSQRRNGVGVKLCEAAAQLLIARGARLIVAELPDDATLLPVARVLEHCGWHEEARIDDFVRDGVALRLLRFEAAM
ncbi:MAG: GNAT family N-acetyltransferase [Gemmatimonadaceae bacterium]